MLYRHHLASVPNPNSQHFLFFFFLFLSCFLYFLFLCIGRRNRITYFKNTWQGGGSGGGSGGGRTGEGEKELKTRKKHYALDIRDLDWSHFYWSSQLDCLTGLLWDMECRRIWSAASISVHRFLCLNRFFSICGECIIGSFLRFFGFSYNWSVLNQFAICWFY